MLFISVSKMKRELTAFAIVLITNIPLANLQIVFVPVLSVIQTITSYWNVLQPFQIQVQTLDEGQTEGWTFNGMANKTNNSSSYLFTDEKETSSEQAELHEIQNTEHHYMEDVFETNSYVGSNIPHKPPLPHKPHHHKNCNQRTCVCGQRYGTNIRGENEFSWIVLLQYKSGGQYFCAGSIISDRFIVTAANCVVHTHEEKIQLDFRGIKKEKLLIRNVHHQKKAEVKKIHIPKSYDPTTGYHDLALLELKDRLSFKRGLLPVCLPTVEEPKPTEKTIVAGWGSEKYSGTIFPHLRRSVVTVISTKKCQYVNKKWRHDSFCAKVSDKAACYVDDGGPLMTYRNGKYHLAGISTNGGCSVKKKFKTYGIFGRTGDLLHWIERKTEKSCYCGAHSEGPGHSFD